MLAWIVIMGAMPTIVQPTLLNEIPASKSDDIKIDAKYQIEQHINLRGKIHHNNINNRGDNYTRQPENHTDVNSTMNNRTITQDDVKTDPKNVTENKSNKTDINTTADSNKTEKSSDKKNIMTLNDKKSTGF